MKKTGPQGIRVPYSEKEDIQRGEERQRDREGKGKRESGGGGGGGGKESYYYYEIEGMKIITRSI